MKNTLLFKKAIPFLFWFAAFLLMFIPTKGFAQLLLTEDFNYGASSGNLQTIATPSWAAHSGTSNYVQYSSSAGLTFTGHAGSGVGGAATVVSSGVGDHNRTFTSQNSGTVYMSCLLRISTAAAGSDYFIHFNSGTFNARVVAQLSGSNIRFGISKAATPTVATTNFNLNTTYMVVVKYTFIAGTANDTCDLWILPAFASTEALAGTPLQSTSAGTDATALNAVGIRQGTAPSATIDAFRVGNTWANIAPAASLINGGNNYSATAFSTTYGTASTSQSFVLAGSLLTNDVLATAGNGFEVSRSDVVSYGATATFTAAEANAGTLSVLVRLKNNANAGNFNTQNAVVLSSSPAASVNIVTSASGNTVAPFGLTITGLTSQNKTFDGNTTATLLGSATLSGVLFSDDVSLAGSAVANYSSAAVGGPYAITVTGFSLTGTKAVNYSLAQPTVANASITPSTLADQVITFPALTSVPYGTVSVSLLATSDNPGGNPITYVSSNTNVATISGSSAIIVGAGTTTITASQAGDGTHNPAIDVSQSLTVSPLGITIIGLSAQDKPYDTNTTATLTGTPVLDPAPINSDDVTISGTAVANFATANVGLQAVTVTGYTLGGTKAGNYTLTQPIVANATINPLAQTITFFGSIPTLTTLTPAVTLTATASSGLPVTFVSSDTNVATISGNILTIVGSGTVTITAQQAGNTNYAAAPDFTQTRTVETALYLNQFTGTSACPTQGNVAAVAANTTGSAVTRSTVTCATLANFFSSTTLNTTASINNNSYIEFSATAATGYRLNLTKMSFARSGSGTAPNQLEMRYSTDGFATSTSMNNTALTTTTATTLTWDFSDFTAPISGTITFRLYPYGTQRSDLVAGTAATTGTLRIDDLTIYGTVVLPPPTVVTIAPPTAITNESAALDGNVTATGGSDVLGNGIVYSSTATTPTIGEPGVIQLGNATPSTGTGAFSQSTGNTLAANTLYYYNAYANSAQGYAYGTVASFYTLANVPVQPAVASNESTTTFDFSFDASNNPATTQYAIQVNGQYVQANGSLSASAVWQTNEQWQLIPTPHAITVTGLNPNTLYTYSVKARNGANVETALGTSNSVTTLQITLPTLLADPLSGFGNVCINTASSARTFGLTGELLESNVTVGPLEGFTFYNALTDTYDTSLTFSPDTNGDVLEIISVKFTPTAVQSYEGNIPVTGGGAAAIDVAVTGVGLNTPATVTTGTVSAITVVGATIAGSAVAGCSTVVDSGIEYSTDSLFTSPTQVSGFPATLNTLAPNTLYFVRAYATDASVSGIAYGTPTSFTTLGLTTGPVATAATSVDATSFVANWEAVAGAESYLLDVSTNSTFSGTLTTIANWSFPNATDNAIIDEGIVDNNGKTLSTVGGVGTIGYSAVSSSTTSAASGPGWDSGNGTKYWQIDISTAGYSDLKLSSAQRSSNTGPRDFKVQYSVNAGANWFDVSNVTVGNNWTTGVLSNIALPVACNNQASVRLRWIMTSNTTVSSGTVAGSGTSGIDSIIVTGRPPSFTVYEALSVNGLSQLVSGLTELTEYHYRVRAFSANSTSPYSNVISVTTTAAPPTFDSVSYNGGTVCDNASATFDVSGLSANVASRLFYNINEGPTVSVVTTVADGSGAATFNIALPIAVNNQVLTITSVERFDASSSTAVESNNQVFINFIAPNVTYYADSDSDGYGNLAVTQESCTGEPSGFVSNSSDCNDSNINIYQFATFYVDADGDGYDAGTASVCSGLTAPAGYAATTSGTDCNDADNTKYQTSNLFTDADGDGYTVGAATAVCYGAAIPSGYAASSLGTDCDDTSVSITSGTTFYADADNDTFGDLATTSVACTQPSGYVTNSTDCDPNDGTKWQFATFYVDADADGYDNGTASVCSGVGAPTGYSAATSGTDCDDNNNLVYQSNTLYADVDGDTYTVGTGTVTCYGASLPAGTTLTQSGNDCDDNDNLVYQSEALYTDADGDGWAVNETTAPVCYGATVPTGYVLVSLGIDCNDTNALLTNNCGGGSVINLTLFVQGYYVGGSAMTSVKLNQDYESPDTDVEDMTIELHDAVDYSLVDTAIGTLKTDGTISVTFNTAAAGSYYIAVKGSNLVQTWSAAPQAVGTTPLNYDFSTSASQAYGDNMLEVEPGVFAMYQGDFEVDDLVDLTDYSVWDAKYLDFAFGVEPTDLNGDGLVDLSDYSIWEINYLNFIFAAYPF